MTPTMSCMLRELNIKISVLAARGTVHKNIHNRRVNDVMAYCLNRSSTFQQITFIQLCHILADRVKKWFKKEENSHCGCLTL